MGRVLLVAEVDNGDLSSGYWEQVSAARQLSAQTGWAMHVLVIGHNPGLEEFAAWVAPRGAEDARERLASGLKTCGLCQIAVEGPWRALEAGGGRLVGYVRPKDLTQ